MDQSLFSEKQRAFNPLLAWESDAYLLEFFKERGERLESDKLRKGLIKRLSTVEGCLKELAISAGIFAMALAVMIAIQSVITGQPPSIRLLLAGNTLFNAIIVMFLSQGIRNFLQAKKKKNRSPEGTPFPDTLFEMLHQGDESGKNLKKDFYTDLYLSGYSGRDILKTLYLEGAVRKRTFLTPILPYILALIFTAAFAFLAYIMRENSVLADAVWCGVIILPTVLIATWLHRKFPSPGEIFDPFKSRAFPLWTQWRQPISWIPSVSALSNIRMRSLIYILLQIMIPGCLFFIFFFWYQQTTYALQMWTVTVSLSVVFFVGNYLLNRKWRCAQALEQIALYLEYADDLFAIYMEEVILNEETEWEKVIGSFRDIFKGARDKLPAKELSGKEPAPATL